MRANDGLGCMAESGVYGGCEVDGCRPLHGDLRVAYCGKVCGSLDRDIEGSDEGLVCDV